jgi:hypothetical protein
MRIDMGGSSTTTPSQQSNPSQGAAPAATAHAPGVPAQHPDTVSKHEGGIWSSVEDWTKDEWTTVAGAVHGLMSAPGIVSNAYRDAAKANSSLGDAVAKTIGTQSPAARQKEIDAVAKAAEGKSSAAADYAAKLSDANRVPRLVEKIEGPVDRGLSAAGRFASKAMDAGIDAAPKAVQSALRGAASQVKGAVSEAYGGVKASVDHSIRTLKPELESSGKQLTGTLQRAAEVDLEKAGRRLQKVSSVIGTTVGDVAPAASKVGNLIDKVPALRDTPLVGMVLAGVGTATDAPKVGFADAAVANYGSTLIGTAAGSATTGVLAGLAGGSLADGAVGVVAATGPVGWAVAGGVVAGAAIGYGAYKAFESQAGQDVINGIASGNGKQIVKGIKETGTDVVHIGESAEHAAVSAGKAIGHGAETAYHSVSNFVSSIF